MRRKIVAVLSSSLLVFTLSSAKTQDASLDQLAKQDTQREDDTSTFVKDEMAKLRPEAPKIKSEVLKLALTAYSNAREEGLIKKEYLTVIDYSLPSSKQRMWVFDIAKDKLLYHTLVSHGKNSGNLYATKFSNKSNSKQSSLGAYITKDTYYGGKGLSLNLKGIDKGVNDHAYSRRIVIHGAWYASKNFVKKTGYLGRSWGCPALPKPVAKKVIPTIKKGSMVFAYYPDKEWISHSKYLTA